MHTHTRTGRLVRVRRGLFAVIPPEADGDTYPIDPYLVTSKLTPDSVLSHHTALEFHGRAYSIWQQFTYLASRPLDTFTFRSQVYRGTKFPEALVRSGAERFSVLTTERAGMSLKVTSLERTFVDILDRPLFSGGWEEVWRSLESVEFFDLDRIVEYVLLLGNATTAAKVGFYLDQHRDALIGRRAPPHGAARGTSPPAPLHRPAERWGRDLGNRMEPGRPDRADRAILGGDEMRVSAESISTSAVFPKNTREANGRFVIRRLRGKAVGSTLISTTCIACLCGLSP